MSEATGAKAQGPRPSAEGQGQRAQRRLAAPTLSGADLEPRPSWTFGLKVIAEEKRRARGYARALALAQHSAGIPKGNISLVYYYSV